MSKKKSKQKTSLPLLFFTALCFSASSVFLFLAVAMTFENNEKPQVLAKRDFISEEIAYWSKLVSDSPSFRDGYIALANLYAEKNDDKKAIMYLQKAREVDPNYNFEE